MDNLEKSERVIAHILTYLLENGLQRTDFSDEDFEIEDEFKPFVPTTLKWLMREGIISASNYEETLGNGYFIIEPTLTSRGFKMLEGQVQLAGDTVKLSDAVKDVHSGNSGFAKAGNFTGGLLASFIQSFG